jgi:hypothetical protein
VAAVSSHPPLATRILLSLLTHHSRGLGCQQIAIFVGDDDASSCAQKGERFHTPTTHTLPFFPSCVSHVYLIPPPLLLIQTWGGGGGGGQGGNLQP